ncbi:MAG: putative manganese transporter [Candidatus Faecousia sp.]|nr:arsenic efflux protein [Clostridiales bacterium]MDD7652224.1 putative manganese transporter [Bacillota bacterium]MDY4220295.1 putative manganese transporter [Candidatus Faecousia sp.]
MLDTILDSLVDTGKILPILFLTYLLMEYLEHHAGGKAARLLQRARGAGPFFGALLGLVPQCGFSGAAASFYAGGAITAGTLLAVFLATSDEMLPILISAQVPGKTVLTILGVKLVCGVLVGFLVDFFLRLRHVGRHREIHEFCEREHCSCDGGILRSALRHTVKIILLIFAVTVLLNLVFLYLPKERIAAVWSVPVLGELLAAIVGLLPNCAASVMITDLYLSGVMGPGPMLAGLLVNAGVGLLVLFRVNRNRRENLAIGGTLLLSGVILGTICGLLFTGIL